MDLVQRSASLEVPLEEILQEAVVFFETLRVEFPKAGKEEREEMVHMMTTLHAKLQEVAKQSAAASGMTEEELNAYSEDPSNFSPEDWQLVQNTRRKLYDSARKFSGAMEEQGEGAPQSTPKRKGVRPKTRRAKKSGWTKT